MKMLLLSLPVILVAACAPAEDLSGQALEARLGGSVLSFVNLDGPEETLILQLRADGTGVATQTKDRDEDAAVEAITWRIDGQSLCLTPPDDSRIGRDDGREECITVQITGNTVILGDGRDFTGTIAPF